VTEIRWHARAGQGAKTAAQLLAEAALRAGKSVQAFPEYGPERRGAPVRAYTRVSDSAIRRHDPITEPDIVVVLEPSLARDPSVADGLREDGLLLVNADDAPAGLGARVRCVPADRLAAAAGIRFANIVMLGAVAAALGEPPLERLEEAAVEALGRKSAPDAIAAALREGYTWAS
jgi:pyruvate ferredoxin oxidoreductase gamma subunit